MERIYRSKIVLEVQNKPQFQPHTSILLSPINNTFTHFYYSQLEINYWSSSIQLIKLIRIILNDLLVNILFLSFLFFMLKNILLMFYTLCVCSYHISISPPFKKPRSSLLWAVLVSYMRSAKSVDDIEMVFQSWWLLFKKALLVQPSILPCQLI